MRDIWPTLRGLFPLLPEGARRFFVIYIVITAVLLTFANSFLGLAKVLNIEPSR